MPIFKRLVDAGVGADVDVGADAGVGVVDVNSLLIMVGDTTLILSDELSMISIDYLMFIISTTLFLVLV